MTQNKEVILQVKDLHVEFDVGRSGGLFSKERKILRAVNGVSFDLYKGETLGLVGESGCGKSTTARNIIQLHRPKSGQVIFHGEDLTQLTQEQMKKHRSEIQMVFQDPYASLDPRMTVGEIIGEPAKILGIYKSKEELNSAVVSMMEKVGLEPRFRNRYPHAFSGGQRQRIGIARALISSPKIILADEPVSALDVSIQAQVLNLFVDLQKEYDLTYVFIAHDLSVVKHMCTRIAVMYLGNIVELAPTDELFKQKPRHPYTEALISAVNVPDPEVERTRERIVLQGDVPSPLNPPSGCPFRTRCAKAQDKCSAEKPALQEFSPGHYAACFFPNE
ncbi:ABC transporter ATP-binding protein [Candidatus Uabimicrobium amorphum]|uniref:ABC transporter ATP-binding protein n=1 Tax=Uabimicrobium amorphum TaxID=2596890 RepID=A0A5S9F587_UABAM|nr:dipeptide ABC transporter ATP-binding protein [Candidatus Uabimicrobium amorphum]BBM85294.1 ABC transporter ATP-binding protein [Candidatus Uabimicrobium amorphum]